jgi:hypothetical protein
MRRARYALVVQDDVVHSEGKAWRRLTPKAPVVRGPHAHDAAQHGRILASVNPPQDPRMLQLERPGSHSRAPRTL